MPSQVKWRPPRAHHVVGMKSWMASYWVGSDIEDFRWVPVPNGKRIIYLQLKSMGTEHIVGLHELRLEGWGVCSNETELRIIGAVCEGQMDVTLACDLGALAWGSSMQCSM